MYTQLYNTRTAPGVDAQTMPPYDSYANVLCTKLSRNKLSPWVGVRLYLATLYQPHAALVSDLYMINNYISSSPSEKLEKFV